MSVGVVDGVRLREVQEIWCDSTDGTRIQSRLAKTSDCMRTRLSLIDWFGKHA